MTAPAKRRAAYADLAAVPAHLVAEIIDGELVTHPRPVPKHVLAANRLYFELTGPFDFGRDGPGGWIFAIEPELHLGEQVVVPDLAGWRRERLPALPDTAYIETAPDWVCEVLSPSTERYDRIAKRRIYAEAGVPHLWLLDPRSQLLEVFALDGQNWRLAGTYQGADNVGGPPFEAISFALSALFPYDLPAGSGAGEAPTPEGEAP
jgi:Uma2 family endonuclease